MEAYWLHRGYVGTCFFSVRGLRGLWFDDVVFRVEGLA